MQAIRNMEPAWVKVQGRNFALLHGIKGVAKRDALGREPFLLLRKPAAKLLKKNNIEEEEKKMIEICHEGFLIALFLVNRR